MCGIPHELCGHIYIIWSSMEEQVLRAKPYYLHGQYVFMWSYLHHLDVNGTTILARQGASTAVKYVVVSTSSGRQWNNNFGAPRRINCSEDVLLYGRLE